MEYSDNQLATHLNVNRSTAFRWRKSGCSTNDLEAAKAWSRNRKPAVRRLQTGELNSIECNTAINLIKNEVVEEVTPIPVAGEDAYSVRDRLQAQEQTISAEI
jgi:hypothetical protein